MGYDQVPDYHPYIQTDLATPMEFLNGSAFLRIPFDYDGVLKRRRELVHDGELAGPVLDLELAARCGRLSTGHGVAGEDATPGHQQWLAGEETEADLLRAIADRFPQVILITHLEGMRDAFDQVIRMSYDVERRITTAREEQAEADDVAA